MKKFLRYRCRHSLYFAREGKLLPELNPMGSSSHNKAGKRTSRVYEPRWMFRLRQRLFCEAGRHSCGSRGSVDLTLPDRWHIGSDGNRTCSYCGSMHPEDLMEICRKTMINADYGVESTTKSYKVYVRQPGVRNAAEGAIKFYMWHAAAKPTREDQELFSTAVHLTHKRFMEAMNARRSA